MALDAVKFNPTSIAHTPVQAIPAFGQDFADKGMSKTDKDVADAKRFFSNSPVYREANLNYLA